MTAENDETLFAEFMKIANSFVNTDDKRLTILEERLKLLEDAFDEKQELEPFKYHCPLEKCSLAFVTKDALISHLAKRHFSEIILALTQFPSDFYV